MAASNKPYNGKSNGDTADFDRVYGVVLILIQLVMIGELTALIIKRNWTTAFIVMMIIAATLTPVLVRRHSPIRLPMDLHILAVAFVFLSLFLGEIRQFYELFWWWDIALHLISGFLLCILGLLLVYILNRTDGAPLPIVPGFAVLFALSFAVTVGTLWEFFEFGMDHLFGLQMQKPTPSDPSGLTDTIGDLIAETVGAVAAGAFGLRQFKRGDRSLIEGWVKKFVSLNQGIFRR